MIAGSIAAVCVVFIVAVAVKQWKRTRQLPYELTHLDDQPISGNYMSLLYLANILAHVWLPKWIFDSIPGAIVLSSVNLAFLVAYLALAIYTFSKSFAQTVDKQLLPEQTLKLIMAALPGIILAVDIANYRSIAWVWIISGVAACFLAPIFTRRVFSETYGLSVRERE
jgi:hypothetical protein